MFFTISKIFWTLFSPAKVVMYALAAGVFLMWRGRERAAKWVLTLTIGFMFAAAILPLGHWMMIPLETRFPIQKTLPDKVDGIIVLGGVVDQYTTKATGQLSLGDAAERLTELVALAKRFPGARLVFSGGSSSMTRPEVKEAEVLAPYLGGLGLDPERVIFESEARNTYENVKFSMPLAKPVRGETWILVTSARHMPRAVGVFRKFGWPVIPFPVDFSFIGGEQWKLSFALGHGLSKFSGGIYSWAGLFYYWVTGKSDSLFPGPENE